MHSLIYFIVLPMCLLTHAESLEEIYPFYSSVLPPKEELHQSIQNSYLKLRETNDVEEAVDALTDLSKQLSKNNRIYPLERQTNNEKQLLIEKLSYLFEKTINGDCPDSVKFRIIQLAYIIFTNELFGETRKNIDSYKLLYDQAMYVIEQLKVSSTNEINSKLSTFNFLIKMHGFIGPHQRENLLDNFDYNLNNSFDTLECGKVSAWELARLLAVLHANFELGNYIAIVKKVDELMPNDIESISYIKGGCYENWVLIEANIIKALSLYKIGNFDDAYELSHRIKDMDSTHLNYLSENDDVFKRNQLLVNILVYETSKLSGAPDLHSLLSGKSVKQSAVPFGVNSPNFNEWEVLNKELRQLITDLFSQYPYRFKMYEKLADFN